MKQPMEGTTPDEILAVTVATRSDLPRPSRRRAEAIRAGLRAFADDCVVDDVVHRTWPKRVPVDGCSSDVRDTYLAWADWVRREEVSLQPFFDTRECYDPAAGDYTDWLVVPAMAVAVTVDDEVVSVYPHEDGNETVTVEDGIDALSGTASRHRNARAGVAD